MQTHKQLTLALSPKISWAVCLKLMRSGTVCTTMVTNSSTFPYCLTFFCRTTCQMYEYVSCRGDAIRRREAKGRAPENEFENITLHNAALTVLLWGQYLKKKKVISGIHTHKLSTNPPCVSDSKLASFGHRKTSDVVPFVGLCHCCL